MLLEETVRTAYFLAEPGPAVRLAWRGVFVSSMCLQHRVQTSRSGGVAGDTHSMRHGALAEAMPRWRKHHKEESRLEMEALTALRNSALSSQSTPAEAQHRPPLSRPAAAKRPAYR